MPSSDPVAYDFPSGAYLKQRTGPWCPWCGRQGRGHQGWQRGSEQFRNKKRGGGGATRGGEVDQVHHPGNRDNSRRNVSKHAHGVNKVHLRGGRCVRQAEDSRVGRCELGGRSGGHKQARQYSIRFVSHSDSTSAVASDNQDNVPLLFHLSIEVGRMKKEPPHQQFVRSSRTFACPRGLHPCPQIEDGRKKRYARYVVAGKNKQKKHKKTLDEFGGRLKTCKVSAPNKRNVSPKKLSPVHRIWQNHPFAYHRPRLVST